MRNYLIIGVAVAGIITGILSCSTRHISQDEIIAFVDDFEKKAEFVDRQVAMFEWQHYTRGQSDSLDYYTGAKKSVYSDPQQLADIEKYLTIVKDDIYARKLELIYRRCLRAAFDSEKKIEETIDSLSAVGRNNMPEFEGQKYNHEQIRKLIAAENDRGRRQAMMAACGASGDKIAEGVISLARMRNHFVSRLGYNSYYDLMIEADGIEKQEFLDLLDELERVSAEPYARALDSLKTALGQDDIRAWDIDHAFNRTDNNMAPYFIADNQKKLLESTLSGLGFKLRSWPIYFSPVASSKSTGRVFSINIPDDIRVVTDIVDGVVSMERLFDQAGRALYAVHIDPGDFLLRQSPAPCFDEGMGLITVGLTGTGGWKRKYAGMPEPLVIEAGNRCEFMRLHGLRKALLNIAFERKLYGDPFADMKQEYELLFEKYMLYPLAGDYNIWAVSADYIEHPVSIQNHLVGQCIAAQTYYYLTEKYGAVLDDQHTREFLVQNYYRFGSRDDWQTLLERGTGERLKGRYFLEYSCD